MKVGVLARTSRPRSLVRHLSLPSALGSDLLLTAALFGLGIVAVGGVVWLFLNGERYLRPARPEKSVGFVQDRLDADRVLSSLAPKMLLLADREKALDGPPETEAPLRSEEAARLWRKFCTASALAEDDPGAACEELRALEAAVEEALERSGGDGSQLG